MVVKLILGAFEMKRLFTLVALVTALLASPAYAGTYDGTENAVTYGNGWNGKGLAGGYITAPLSLNTALGSGPITIEARFKIGANPSSNVVITGSTGLGWIGVSQNGYLRFSNNSTNGSEIDIDSHSIVTDGEWHTATMLLAPAEGNYPEVFAGYLDGNQIGVHTGNILFQNTAHGFGIGAFENGLYPFPGTIDEVSFWNIAKNWRSFTPLSVPYQGIENGSIALYHLDGNAADSVTNHVTAPVSGNSPVYFSPYTWANTPNGQTSINAGAYLKTSFSGSQCSITINSQDNNTFNVPSEVEVWVDDMEGKIYSVNQDSIPCSPSSLISTSQHSLRMAFKSSTEGASRWTTDPYTKVVVRGINIGAGQSFSMPKVYPRTLLFYGDSITEGVRTLGETQPRDVDRNDNSVEWSAQVAQRLNAEYGIVGFGATGLTVSGSGGVPPLKSTWNLLYPGQNRSFASCPDAMIENEGTNDILANASDVQAAETAFLTDFSAMCPSTKSIIMRPFNGAQWSALQSSVAGMGSRNISLLDTTGFLNPAMGVDSLGVHPTANNAVNFIAPQVAASVRRIIEDQPTQTYTFR